MARHRPSTTRALARAVALALLALAVLAAAAPPVAADPPSDPSPPGSHLPPVGAPVVDPFRPPAHPWEAGNRGLEYGTAPGTVVAATAAGTVVFAGTVAGTRHVTIRHADGVRTSYSFLDRIDVVVGQRVDQGDVVGTTAGRLHLGARRGDAYFDPASLFEPTPARVHLVPFEIPPGGGQGGERSALAQLVGGVGGLLHGAADRVLRPTGATVAWLAGNGPRLLRTAAQYLEPVPIRVARRAWAAWQAAERAARRPCTAEDQVVGPPPGRRVAVTVGGFGSSSAAAAIDDLDVAGLGYEPGDVARFSYRGGRTPGTGASFTAVPARPYDAADSQGDLYDAATRLADLVEAVAAAAPGTPIDVLAHSQGGVVARLALAELVARHGGSWLERLGVVVTIGAPHGGADLATGVDALGSTGTGSRLFDGLQLALHLDLDDDAPAVAQLSESSDLVRGLADEPVPDGVALRSIAARGDLTVPVPRTAVPGGLQVVVPVDGLHAHDSLPGTEAASREVALAIAGRPPTCVSFREALIGQAVGEAVSFGEDAVASFGWWALGRQGKPLGG